MTYLVAVQMALSPGNTPFAEYFGMLLGLIILYLTGEITKVEFKANKGLCKILKKRKGAKKVTN